MQSDRRRRLIPGRWQLVKQSYRCDSRLLTRRVVRSAGGRPSLVPAQGKSQKHVVAMTRTLEIEADADARSPTAKAVHPLSLGKDTLEYAPIVPCPAGWAEVQCSSCYKRHISACDKRPSAAPQQWAATYEER